MSSQIVATRLAQARSDGLMALRVQVGLRLGIGGHSGSNNAHTAVECLTQWLQLGADTEGMSRRLQATSWGALEYSAWISSPQGLPAIPLATRMVSAGSRARPPLPQPSSSSRANERTQSHLALGAPGIVPDMTHTWRALCRRGLCRW